MQALPVPVPAATGQAVPAAVELAALASRLAPGGLAWLLGPILYRAEKPCPKGIKPMV